MKKEYKKHLKEDYNKYLKSDEWKAVRKKVFDERGNQCERCRETSRLQVHHKHYKNIFNEKLEDLEILCQECHNIHHSSCPYIRHRRDCLATHYLKEFLKKEGVPKLQPYIERLMDMYAKDVSCDFSKYLAINEINPDETDFDCNNWERGEHIYKIDELFEVYKHDRMDFTSEFDMYLYEREKNVQPPPEYFTLE